MVQAFTDQAFTRFDRSLDNLHSCRVSDHFIWGAGWWVRASMGGATPRSGEFQPQEILH